MVTRVQMTAHLSDLHIGRGRQNDRRAEALCRALLERCVDHVVVSGDVTHRGLRVELERFRAIFAPLLADGRCVTVPGNHDRLGDDVGADLAGERIRIEARPGLHLVLLDSTGIHNRSFFAGHGEVSSTDMDAVVSAFDCAGPGALRVLALHHHLLPLPHDNHFERAASWLGWSSGEEVAGGPRFIERLRGRCDLVLHGHRHMAARATVFADDARPVSLYNAGSSTELAQARVFVHRAGRLCAPPIWVDGGIGVERPAREYVRLHRSDATGSR